MNEPADSDALALVRHAAATWIQEALKQNFTLARATALASERTWGGKNYSASTLETWYYLLRNQGFDALHRQARKDKGSRKALSPEACQSLLEWRQKYPQLTIKVVVRQLIEKGILQSGAFSLPSVYRFLAAHQLDARSIKRNPPSPLGGPTKAFECALANQLWMTDMMFGPTLKLAGGKVIQTRLFALLDDCSRLIPHAQYYDSEKLCWFLDCLRQGLAQRGFPEKLYTDQGKIFTSYHLQIVCANLGVRICHAQPYAAWSKGKLERWFRTLQMDFEARLVIDPVHTLEDLNARLWRWIEGEYHQRSQRLGGADSSRTLCPTRRQLAHRRPADRLGSSLSLPRSTPGAPGCHLQPGGPTVGSARSPARPTHPGALRPFCLAPDRNLVE
jgi:transposase InsO family protein